MPEYKPLMTEERESLQQAISSTGCRAFATYKDDDWEDIGRGAVAYIRRYEATVAALEAELECVGPVVAAARQYAAARWKWLREGDFDGSRQRAMEAAAKRVADTVMYMLFSPLLVEEERDD